MVRNAKLRRAWFYHSLTWSTLGPFMYLFITTKGQFLPSLMGGLLSGPPMAIGLYAFNFYISPATKRLAFPLSILAQTGVIAGMLTVSFFLGVVGIDSVLTNSSFFDKLVWVRASKFFSMPDARLAYFITIFSIFAMLVGFQLGRKLGPGTMWNWITGYYHRPREEERIFMFLDIRGSTTLAEQLGHFKFSMMIQDFFFDMTGPILISGGVVSHYIGDEAVLTWKVKDGLKEENCIHFFYRMQEEIALNAGRYQERYGLVPEFKAGLHMGHVVTCEVGYAKSEIVYLGDVLNTTARIQGLCDKLGEPLLISGELKDRLSNSSFNLTDHGPQELKGKAEAVTVFGVNKPA